VYVEPPKTTTITLSTGGVKPAVVGGVAAGITGGFLLLGAALVFFLLSHRPEKEPVYNDMEELPASPNGDRMPYEQSANMK
jgi:hypothetical protein